MYSIASLKDRPRTIVPHIQQHPRKECHPNRLPTRAACSSINQSTNQSETNKERREKNGSYTHTKRRGEISHPPLLMMPMIRYPKCVPTSPTVRKGPPQPNAMQRQFVIPSFHAHKLAPKHMSRAVAIRTFSSRARPARPASCRRTCWRPCRGSCSRSWRRGIVAWPCGCWGSV